MELLAIPILWILFAFFSAALASNKNRSVVGWFCIGFLFGPFGLLVGLMDKVPARPAPAPGHPSWTGSERESQEFWAAVTGGPLPAAPMPENKPCPFCAETIKAAAIVCRYCGRDLPQTARPVKPAEGQVVAVYGEGEARTLAAQGTLQAACWACSAVNLTDAGRADPCCGSCGTRL